ncbi:LCP family protein [Angustibacter sp. McL0619]|uniref:LCP family protein n=1 Tax=Angustibacter sp. McL0619 TaxID=3415676 RepID=UPI003CF28F42
MSTTSAPPGRPKLSPPHEPEVRSPGLARSARRLADPRYLDERGRRRRAVTLILLTLVLPGSAQIAAGRRQLGRLGLRVWCGCLALFALTGITAWLDRGLVLRLLTTSWVLLVLAVALVALAILWAVLLVDAWRLGRPALQTLPVRRFTAALTAALVLVTGVPLVYAARQVAVGRSVLTQVFGGNEVSAVHDGRLNVLLMGGDAGSDRIGVRPDSLTLASIDVSTGRTVLLSFPRNMQNIPFPASSPMHAALPHGFDCGDTCLLNAVYTYATEHKGLYPPEVKDPGAQATMDAVSAISGLKVNYYVLMDLQGFSDLVDAVGGVRINVRQALPIGNGTTLKTGTHTLNGYHALWYARSRHADSDYARMARQRCVMTAMLDQLDPQTVLTRFRSIALASTGLVRTSVPQSQIGMLVELALKAKSQKISSVQFVPPLVVPAHPDFAAMRALAASTIAASERASTTAQPTAGSTTTSRPSTGSASPASPSATAAATVSAARPRAVCSAG